MRVTPRMTVALLAAQEAQTTYWDALLALEKALGVEVDGTQDLFGVTVEYLLEAEQD